MSKDVNIQIALPPEDRVAELTHTANHFSLTLLSVFSRRVMSELARGKEKTGYFQIKIECNLRKI